MDGVPSWITSEAVYTLNFRNLLDDADSVKILSQQQSSVLMFMRMVSHPGHSSCCCRWCTILDHSSFCGWCPILVTAPEMQEEKGISGDVTIYASILLSGATRQWSQHQRYARGDSLQVYIDVYVLTSKSVLQSSTELAHVGYIYI